MSDQSNCYGFCPTCGAPAICRERRPDGNDRCENGHVYPSRDSVMPLEMKPKKKHTIKAHERIISDQCRENRGDSGAVINASFTAQNEMMKLMEAWPKGKGAKIILTVSVEYDQ